MVAIQILGFVALAASALAAPIAPADSSKPFRIGVTFGQDTLFLTSTSIASPNKADGVFCTIDAGKLGCGPEKKAFTYSEFHTTKPLQLVESDKKNVNWSIGADGVVQWGAKQGAKANSVTFSRQSKKNPNEIFAEVCTSFDHHTNMPAVKDFWERGVAKAYYD